MIASRDVICSSDIDSLSRSGKLHHHAECAAARNDRGLVDRIGRDDVEADDGVAALVVGRQQLLFLGHNERLALGAHHHLVFCFLELGLGHHPLVAAGGGQRGLVDEVHQVGAGEAGCTARDGLEVDIRRQRNFTNMNLEDLLAADDVRVRHHHLAVEAAGTQQRGIQHVGTVGRRDQDHAFISLEAVHLDEQLVERLFALVIAAAETGATMTAHRVDFVDEDDAGRVLLGLLEHVTDTARTDADEHFDEVRTRDREERHVGFARDRTRDQGLAGAGRTDQQHAARNPSAEALEFSGIAQEFDDLLQVLLGFVDTGDVLEGDAAMGLRQHLGARFAEAHRLAGTALHLAGQEDPHADQRDEGQPGNEQRDKPRHIVAGRLRGDRDLAVIEALHQRRVARRVGLERGAVGEGAVDLRPLDHDVANAVLVDLAQQLRKRNVLGGRALTRILEEREQCQQQQDNDYPEGEIAQIGVH